MAREQLQQNQGQDYGKLKELQKSQGVSVLDLKSLNDQQRARVMALLAGDRQLNKSRAGVAFEGETAYFGPRKTAIARLKEKYSAMKESGKNKVRNYFSRLRALDQKGAKVVYDGIDDIKAYARKRLAENQPAEQVERPVRGALGPGRTVQEGIQEATSNQPRPATFELTPAEQLNLLKQQRNRLVEQAQARLKTLDDQIAQFEAQQAQQNQANRGPVPAGVR